MIFLANPNNAKQLHKFVLEDKIRYLTKGVYIQAKSQEDSDAQIREKILEIMKHLNIQGIISYSSTLYHNFIDENNTVWVAGKTAREVQLDNISIKVIKGNDLEKNECDTIQIKESSLREPNFYRAILQNFSQRKVDQSRINKSLAIQKIIEHTIQIKDKDFSVSLINFKSVAKKLGLDREYQEIEKEIIFLKSQYNTLDFKRVKLFDQLLENIENFEFHQVQKIEKNNILICDNISFFESYFSNYIEGTEFEVMEAYEIIFDPTKHYTRYQDGHDIKSSFNMMKENIINPIHIKTSIDYIKQLKKWHQEILSHRQNEMIVGNFKHHKNQAGSVAFVLPELVQAMLEYSFNLSLKIDDPIKKAFFLKTTFTEIHPFEDGNGRMSRIVLNNILSLNGYKRIIIPNVFREDYLLGLKAFSNNNNPLAILKMYNKSILITNSMPFEKQFHDLVENLNQKSAFSNPNESMWGIFPTVAPDNQEQFDLFKQIKPIH